MSMLRDTKRSVLCICHALALVILSAGNIDAVPDKEGSRTIAVRVDFFFEPPPPSGALSLVASPSRAEPNRKPVEIIISESRLYEFDVDEGTDVKITCSSKDYWCPESILRADEAKLELYLPVFKAVSISGKVSWDSHGEAMPTLFVQGWLRLSDKLAAPTVSFLHEVKVTDTGRFQFYGPEGILDLRIAAEGSVPHYLWNVKSIGRTKDLGQLSLRTGSSLSGYVWDGVTDLPALGATVRLVPAGVDTDSVTDQRAKALLHETQANDRGFFQLKGMSAGVYQLDAIANQRALRTVGTIEILEDSEVFMNTRIVLSPLLQVGVQLNPPFVDEETPWSLRLVSHGKQIGDDWMKTVMADGDGIATFSGLLPQTYVLEVQDTKSESTYFTKEILVEDDDFLFVDVPVVRLKGELTLNGDPLGAASVRIDTGSKDKIFLKSDPELGRFSGIIRTPEYDLLIIEIRSEDPGFSRRIVVENPEISDGLLEVKLDLVGVDVPGIVVDREGLPVSGAKVNVWSGRSIVSDSKTDARGEFTLTALDEGLYEIQAESTAKGNSEPVALEIRKNVLPPLQRLVLQQNDELHGVLRSADGRPIPGARITAWAVGPIPTNDSGESDVEGKFRLDIGAESSHVLLTVWAPSQVLWSGCLKLAPEANRQLSLTLPPVPGARLEIEWTGSQTRPPDIRSRSLLVTSDGGLLTFNDFVNWTALIGNPEHLPISGAHWVFPRIAAGRQYAVLESTESELQIAIRLCLLGPSPELDWVYLSEGGSERIEIDVSDR